MSRSSRRRGRGKDRGAMSRWTRLGNTIRDSLRRILKGESNLTQGNLSVTRSGGKVNIMVLHPQGWKEAVSWGLEKVKNKVNKIDQFVAEALERLKAHKAVLRSM